MLLAIRDDLRKKEVIGEVQGKFTSSKKRESPGEQDEREMQAANLPI